MGLYTGASGVGMKSRFILISLIFTCSFMPQAIAQSGDICDGLSPVDCELLQVDLKRDRSVEDMLADLDRIVAKYPQAAAAYKTRALFRQDETIRDYRGAAADLTQVIRLLPKDFAAYYDRDLLRANHLNDRSGAIRDLQSFLTLLQKDKQAQASWAEQAKEARQTLGRLRALKS
jgi:tetratricopeptide (TPR) repeat protein